MELIPYIGKGDSSDKFLICQPEFRCCRQPWSRKVSEGVEVDIVKGSGNRPGQANSDNGEEDLLDRYWCKLRRGTGHHGEFRKEEIEGGRGDEGLPLSL